MTLSIAYNNDRSFTTVPNTFASNDKIFCLPLPRNQECFHHWQKSSFAVPAADLPWWNQSCNWSQKRAFSLKFSCLCHGPECIEPAFRTCCSQIQFMSLFCCYGFDKKEIISTYFHAAIAAGNAASMQRDSLPPKPPPILFTFTVTRLYGISRASATFLYKLCIRGLSYSFMSTAQGFVLEL